MKSNKKKTYWITLTIYTHTHATHVKEKEGAAVAVAAAAAARKQHILCAYIFKLTYVIFVNINVL